MIKKSNIRFIDLGLPSKILWGNRYFSNKYYQWGDLIGYSKYQVGKEKIFDDKHYKFYKNDKITKYNDSDGLTKLQPEDDIVTLALGNNYRIPRKEDFEELIEYTEIIYKTYSVIFRSKINGNQIIFPLLGYADESSVFGIGIFCLLWSSSLFEDYFDGAWEFYIFRNRKQTFVTFDSRSKGYIIRPVYDKEN